MAEITETRTKERIKQTGEVFTPLKLVDEILQKLPIELFEDPTKTFLDPAAGDGNFIVRVLAFKEAYGASVWEAISTTYAVELMPDNVVFMHERILAWADNMDRDILGMDKAEEKYGALIQHNYVCANSLEFNYDAWRPYDPDGTGAVPQKINPLDLLEF